MGFIKSSAKREVYSINTNIKKKSHINNLTLHLKELEIEEQTKPKVIRWREITNIRADVGQRVQTFIYEMHMFWRSNEQHGNYC